jgi:hypothetical protein
VVAACDEHIFFACLISHSQTDFDRARSFAREAIFEKQESDLWSDRLLFDLTFGRQFFFVQFQLGARLENNLPASHCFATCSTFFGQFSGLPRAQRASFCVTEIMPFHEPSLAVSGAEMQNRRRLVVQCLFKREEFDAACT